MSAALINCYDESVLLKLIMNLNAYVNEVLVVLRIMKFMLYISMCRLCSASWQL